MPIFTTMLKCHFRTGLKSLAMYVEHHQTIYLGRLKRKENLEEKENFPPKSWVNPFAKMPIFRLY